MESAAGPSNTTMNEFRSKDRSSNFTKDECQRLQQLVIKHKNILMCKKTDGCSSKQKENSWRSIEREFNANGLTPRTMKQLKYKFENIKRSAKKEASRERQEMIRTGGGKPPSLTPDSEDTTDWLRAIMSGSVDGNEALYDDDSLPHVRHIAIPKTNEVKIIRGQDTLENPPQKELNQTITEDATIDPSNESINIEDMENNIYFDSSTPYSSLKRPIASSLKRTSLINKKQKNNDNVIKRALREKKISVLDGLNNLELQKIKLSISHQNELHQQLLRHNEEKHILEIKKLQLEIDLLEKKINCDD